MEKFIVFDPALTEQDHLVVEDLTRHAKHHATKDQTSGNATDSATESQESDSSTLYTLNSWNDPNGEQFRPTVAEGVDYNRLASIGKLFNARILQPYIRIAQSIVRVETDVVILTNLLRYFLISVPSALILFFVGFSWPHACLHFVMQASQMGSFLSLTHNHLHQNGLLRKQQPFAFFDHLFPYILGPLFGQDWNSFYYHHIKHHHVEGNGPNDLSSTIRYQRDNAIHFLIYLTRFILLVPIELPIYFIRKRQYKYAFSNTIWRIAYYVMVYQLYQCNPRPTLFVFVYPHILLQIGLVNANWAQHAFVNEEEPGSDYNSSITVIDANENRYGYNDGYHTSHHLNPRRHWREHPNSFIKGKEMYASQQALVFHNIDFKMITFRLLLQDYVHLAKCMIPIGEQIHMSMDERVNLLKRLVRMMTKEEIEAKFAK